MSSASVISGAKIKTCTKRLEETPSAVSRNFGASFHRNTRSNTTKPYTRLTSIVRRRIVLSARAFLSRSGGSVYAVMRGVAGVCSTLATGGTAADAEFPAGCCTASGGSEVCACARGACQAAKRMSNVQDANAVFLTSSLPGRLLCHLLAFRRRNGRYVGGRSEELIL